MTTAIIPRLQLLDGERVVAAVPYEQGALIVTDQGRLFRLRGGARAHGTPHVDQLCLEVGTPKKEPA